MFDDITRKKLEGAFGPSFPDAIEALLNLWRAARAEEAASTPREPEPFRPRPMPPLTPLVSAEGFDILIRVKRNEHGVYEAHCSPHHSAPALVQGIYVHTRGRNAIEVLTRLAPQLGEALETAESIDECEQLNRYYAEQVPPP